jgi:mono/diheme cytochrome c family protein
VVVLTWLAGQAPAQEKPAPVDFDRQIQPLFQQYCHRCHGPEKQKSGLRLDRRDDALQGGDLGPAILAKKSSESNLYRYIAGLDDGKTMPPTGEKLKPDQIALIKAWIDQGAPWPVEGKTEVKETWWSLKPLLPISPPFQGGAGGGASLTPLLPGGAGGGVSNPTTPSGAKHPTLTLPSERGGDKWIRTPVDAFILARLREKGLTPAPEADRRTLIRRLFFDLIGLPPTPDDVDRFVANPDPLAFEKLVDSLLASPRHGERWARHWLDVVHYGETHGYDKDKPRPHAWPYRDYVIRSFNTDKPYARFVQEQLAGDVLYPGTRDGFEALGFIAAGPWDFIGHEELPETKIDGKIARHLDRDDMVANTINTFQSLTVHCAQCHNHKFDPIPQEDYYRLHAVFAALDRANKEYDDDPKIYERRVALKEQQRKLDAEFKEVTKDIENQAGERLKEIDQQIKKLGKPVHSQNARFGYHSALAASPDQVKWVQLDLGKPVEIAAIVYTAAYDDFNKIGAGFGFPRRYRIDVSDDPDFRTGVRPVKNQSLTDDNPPGTEPQKVTVRHTARYVRFTALSLAPRQNDYNFALAELAVLDAAGKNLATTAKVSARDTIEAPPRWSKQNLIDGITPPTAPSATALKRLQDERQKLIKFAVDKETLDDADEIQKELKAVATELKKLPAPRVVYAGTIHTGTGTFLGTGAGGGKPRPIYLLQRGNVQKPGKEVGAGALSAFTHLPAVFPTEPNQPEGERRAALARWLTHRDNPLTWRSVVNRVWLYHFGRGLVDTPNDFGKMGQLPTHPELLDWLAVEFRDNGQSFKKLHRLLVTSAVYRQASSHSNPKAADSIDAGNTLYWKMTRRRLEAEAVRDAILSVSGKLDLTMGGPSYQDFVIDKPEHSPHYEYHLHNPDDPSTHRRSIYRAIVRSQQHPWLATLDCADPSLLVDKRNQTISPLQALAMLNNDLVLAMSKHFAARVKLKGDMSAQVREAFRLAIQRDPTPAELAKLTAFAKEQGLENTCRVLMNLNEFVFVE